MFARRTVSFSRRREIPTYTDPLSVDRFFVRVFIGSIAFRVRIESGKKQPRERSGKAWNQPDGEIRASPRSWPRGSVGNRSMPPEIVLSLRNSERVGKTGPNLRLCERLFGKGEHFLDTRASRSRAWDRNTPPSRLPWVSGPEDRVPGRIRLRRAGSGSGECKRFFFRPAVDFWCASLKPCYTCISFGGWRGKRG